MEVRTSKMDTPSVWTTRDHHSRDVRHEGNVSLSDEDMLESHGDDAWSDDVSRTHSHSTQDRRTDGVVDTDGDETTSSLHRKRSRRLLTQQQSKVLYQLLEKTHFPSTHVREAIAKQLGVSPRKVQVWFQNRRQVGKKKMVEAVQATKVEKRMASAGAPSMSASVLAYERPRMLPIVSQSQQSTMKTVLACHPPERQIALRENQQEDERTQAWRDHTMRLACMPSHEPQEHYHAEAWMPTWSRPRPSFEHQAHAGNSATGFASRHRAMQSISRSVASLRIDVPVNDRTSFSATDETTPMYRGPGSAAEQERMLSAAALESHHHRLSQRTPVAARGFPTPTIVSSQHERHPHQPNRARSQTMAVPAHHMVETREVTRSDQVRSLRGDLTLEWQEKQRLYHQRQEQTSTEHETYRRHDRKSTIRLPYEPIHPLQQRHERAVAPHSRRPDALSPAILARVAAASKPTSPTHVHRRSSPPRPVQPHQHLRFRQHNAVGGADQVGRSEFLGRLRSASNPSVGYDTRATFCPPLEARLAPCGKEAETYNGATSSSKKQGSAATGITQAKVDDVARSSTHGDELPPLLGTRKRSADHLGPQSTSRPSPAKMVSKLLPIVEPCLRPASARPTIPATALPPPSALHRDPRWLQTSAVRQDGARDQPCWSATSSSRASSSCSSSTSPPSSSSPPPRPPALPAHTDAVQLKRPDSAQPNIRLSPMDVRSIT